MKMSIKKGVTIMLVSTLLCSCSFNNPYKGLKPSDYSKREVKNQILKYYNAWYNKYIREDTNNGGKYVYWKADEENKDNTATVSEAHGYGMLILVNMANLDSKNNYIYRKDFDDFVKFYNQNRSSVIDAFMCWKMVFDEEGNVNSIESANSATDGDIDIAYSLILADELWGSDGEFNYIDIAKDIVTAFRENMISENNYLYIGDSVLKYFKHDDLIRSSDFIMEALYKFKKIDTDNENVWQDVINETDKILNTMFMDYSEGTGLIPNFILNTEEGYVPAIDKQLENANDGDFSYNACRTSFRVGEYSLYNKDNKYDEYLLSFANWAKTKTKENPREFNAGYYITNGEVGTPLPNSNYESLAFIAPLLISASVAKEQLWYDKIYNYIINKDIKNEGYYGNTLKMLILISGTGNKIY